MTCPNSEKLVAFLDEQLPVSESRILETHLEGCESCRAELERNRELLEAVREDIPANTTDHLFMDGVMDAIDKPAKKPFKVVYAAAAGLAFAAAVPLFFLFTQPVDDGEFTSRAGDQDTSVAALVDLVPLVSTGAELHEISDGAMLKRTDGLTFKYTNQYEKPVYFMAFAIDAREDIHWFYPAYLSEDQDPEAVELARKQREQLMPDIVQPEGVLGNDLEIIVLISTERSSVKEIEALLRKKTTADALNDKGEIIKKWHIKYL